MKRSITSSGALLHPKKPRRKGIFFVLAIINLLAAMTFVGMSVDLGMITVTKSRMQSAADAAALGAAQEIVVGIRAAGEKGESDVMAVQSMAAAAARDMAEQICALNGFYVDPNVDVLLGRRILSDDGVTYQETWGIPPFNMVRVNIRKTNSDPTQPDAKLPLVFAAVVGERAQSITADAVAFIESRDIVAVLDYSGSMAFDSQFRSDTVSRLGRMAVEDSLDNVWTALVDADVGFSNDRSTQKFPALGFGEISSPIGPYSSEKDSDKVFDKLDLKNVPFPQEGKNNYGTLRGKPSPAVSKALWQNYIEYVITDSTLNSQGYRKHYGYRTLMHYLIARRKANYQSEDLWRAPVQPHHAMKQGVSMLARFLDRLGYGDQLGLVTYATTSRIETGITEDGADTHVDLGGRYLTNHVMKIDTIQRQKQAGHYNSATGIGYGVEDAVTLLTKQGRYGAQKVILLMTDGQSNQYPAGFGTDSLPPGWNWHEITDFDEDGKADVIFDSTYKGVGPGDWRAALHTFVRAKEAFDAGYVVNTISLGGGSDTILMSAIAKLTGGSHVLIDSGTSSDQMEADLKAAFAVLAGKVPPARLLVDGD